MNFSSTPDILTQSDRFNSHSPKSSRFVLPPGMQTGSVTRKLNFVRGPQAPVMAVGQGFNPPPAQSQMKPPIHSLEEFRLSRGRDYNSLSKQQKKPPVPSLEPSIQQLQGIKGQQGLSQTEAIELRTAMAQNKQLVAENAQLKVQIEQLQAKLQRSSSDVWRSNELAQENQRLGRELERLRGEVRASSNSRELAEAGRLQENSRKTDFLMSEVERLRADMARQTQSYNQFAEEYNKLKFEAFQGQSELQRLSNMVAYLNDQCSHLSRVNSSLRDDMSRKSMLSTGDSLSRINPSTLFNEGNSLAGAPRANGRNSLLSSGSSSSILAFPQAQRPNKPFVKEEYR